MHILHVIDSLALGGAERMLIDLANATHADGVHSVSVCITRPSANVISDLHPEIRVWVLDRKKRFDWRAFYAFAHIVADEKVDLIHTHITYNFAFVALIRALKLINAPILLHDHLGDAELLEVNKVVPTWLKWWGKYHLAAYVGVYQKLADGALAAGIPKSKVRVIENALDLARLNGGGSCNLRAQFGIPESAPMGICVGGIRLAKGIDTLLEAVTLMGGKAPFHLFIVGGDREPAYTARCHQRALASDLRGKVTFWGERSDVPTLLNSVDFAVMPSRSESGPLVLIEYMLAGLPFVSTTVGGISNRVAAMNLPEFVSPDDPVLLSQALERLVQLPPDERRKRGLKGKQIAQENFDIRRVLPQWYAVYHDAVRKELR